MNLFWKLCMLQKSVFTHPGGHERLPKQMSRCIKEWKRPNEIFGTNDELVVVSKDDRNDINDLLKINESLMNVKVIKI